MAVSATLTGGRAGRTTNGASDTYGSNGNNGGLSGFQTPNVPGVSPGADCFPDLRVAKSNGVSSLNNGNATTYTLIISNNGGAASSRTATIVDVLPTGITIADGAVALADAQAANWNCSAASNVLPCTSATLLAAGASSVFSFVAQMATVANGSSVTNRVRIGGGDLNSARPARSTGAKAPARAAGDIGG